MKRQLLLLCLLIGMGSLMAQSGQDFWQSVNPATAKTLDRTQPYPLTYKAYSLDFDQIKTYLRQAPLEGNGQNSSLSISLPGPDNQWIDFDIVETLVMPASLGVQYPGIKTFLGKATNDPNTYIRLDFTYLGFHAKISNPEYVWWIEPVALENTSTYLGFYNKDANNQTGFFCGVEDDDHHHETRPSNTSRNNSGAELRTYQFAVASDATFTAALGGKTNALSTITSHVNFLNDVTERDLALRFQLVANNNLIIFDNTDDPYNANNPPLAASWISDLLNENTTRLNQILGTNNYDVGHILSGLGGSNGVAGIARIRSICSSVKGHGLTTNASGAVGTGFLEFFTHEVGHQMGGNHTFHSDDFNCAGNRSSSSAFEPGNGTTIMSYPGCEFVANTDFYYHVHSYQEIFQYTTQLAGNTCATITNTGNQPPVIDSMPQGGWVIPISTPFVLGASASDPDGDAITYGWEQYDRVGASTPINNPSGNAPIFRSYPAVPDSFRYFPRMQEILTGNSTTGERLPTYSRDLTFRLNVRDNKLGGGGRTYEQLDFDVSDQAGPFVVTSPGSNAPTYVVGNLLDIRWDVANTDQAPINCQKVDILLSTNAGSSFDVVLAEGVDNDGSFSICTPNFPGLVNRIMVKASDNIFLNVSQSNFVIQAASSNGFSFFNNETDKVSLCRNGAANLSFESCIVGNSTEKFGIRGIGLPPGVTLVSTPDSVVPGQPFTVTLESSSITPVGNFAFSVNGFSNSGATSTSFFDLEIFPAFNGAPVATAANNINDASSNPTLEWTAVNGATGYYYELSSDPAFLNILASGNVSGTSVSIPTTLSGLTTYYWRVAAVVECGNGPFSALNVFRTGSCNVAESIDVPKTIDAFGSLPIEVRSNLDYTGPVPTDVNVFLEGTHDKIKDLSVSVISPSGIEISLFTNACSDNDKDFNLLFDTEANTATLPCPPTTGEPVRPTQPLSFFYGSSPNGTWQLRIRDFESFNGGELTRWGIEFCQPVNSDLQLINNDLLYPPVNSTRVIFPTMLKAQSSNVSDSNITFTLVSNPQFGSLAVDGVTIVPGETFTQADIENSLFTYTQNGTVAPLDSFNFFVEDPNGGWVGVNQFNIGIISSNQPLADFQLVAHPNPANDLLFINLSGANGNKANVSLMDLQGKLVKTNETGLSNGSAETTINLSDLAGGVYLLEVEVNGSKQVQKILKN